MDYSKRSAEIKSQSSRVVIATETPVIRVDAKGRQYWESFDLSSESNVNLDRAPLPLIVQHEGKALPVGAVNNLRIENRELIGDVTWSESERAQELKADVEAGVLRSVSIGYDIDEAKQSGIGERDLPVVTVFRLTPLEVSLVSIPADHRANFRSYKEKTTMIVEDTQTTETNDIQEALQNYDLQGVVASVMGDTSQRSADIGREIELSQEFAKRGNITMNGGVFIPDAVLYGQRAANDALIGTDHRPDLHIGIDRNAYAFLGKTRSVSGLTGNISVPKQSKAAAAGWFNADGTGTIPSTDIDHAALTGTPKYAGAISEFALSLIYQSSPDIEQLLRSELQKSVNEVIDKAIGYGDGKNNAPIGIFNTPGITKKVTTTAGKVTLDEVADIEEILVTNLAPKIEMTTGAKMGRQLKYSLAYPTASGNGKTVREAVGLPLDYSGNVLTDEVFMGDLSQVLFLTWGGTMLEASNSHGNNFANGKRALRIIRPCDVMVRNPQMLANLKFKAAA